MTGGALSCLLPEGVVVLFALWADGFGNLLFVVLFLGGLIGKTL